MEDYKTYSMIWEEMRVTLEIPKPSKEDEMAELEIKKLITAAFQNAILNCFPERTCR